MSIKVKLTNAPKPTRMLDVIEAKGLELLRGENGDVMVRIPFPGVKAVELDRKGIEGIMAVLNKEVPMGDSPQEVFARSASVDSEGNLTARFSDKERARSVEFTAGDRQDIMSFLSSVHQTWNDYEGMLLDAEKTAE